MSSLSGSSYSPVERLDTRIQYDYKTDDDGDKIVVGFSKNYYTVGYDKDARNRPETTSKSLDKITLAPKDRFRYYAKKKVWYGLVIGFILFVAASLFIALVSDLNQVYVTVLIAVLPPVGFLVIVVVVLVVLLYRKHGAPDRNLAGLLMRLEQLHRKQEPTLIEVKKLGKDMHAHNRSIMNV